eukprot:GILK01006255.1.p1 GENE.GILK01006255.1~~GILK01006255.1.p1  ORF type:complete len:339 (-),score=30.47 GILK01006255.1:861-1877(-)
MLRARFSLFLFCLCYVSIFASFLPTQSSSFHRIPRSSFRLSYLEGSELSGFLAEDEVQLGTYSARLRFGCVEKSSPADETSGILGLGFPLGDVLKPLLYRLHAEASTESPNPLIFSLLLSTHGGQLQVGGYDPKSIVEDSLVTVDVLPHCEDLKCQFDKFRIHVDSIRLGDTVLFSASSDHLSKPMEGIVDSGTTCIVLPTVTALDSGVVNVYSRFSAVPEESKHVPLFITIGGKEFEISPEDFFTPIDDAAGSSAIAPDAQSVPSRPCITTLASVPELLLLGNVFLRSLVVVHNLTDAENPKMSFAARNPSYSLISSSSSSSFSSSAGIVRLKGVIT